jgi:prephenate dehydratase
VFRVRNLPAALYKALGGFATSGVNMIKLESYLDNAFTQAAFYADIMGHPAHENVRLAFEELRFFSHHVEVLGVYPADPFRERVSGA